MFKNFLNAIVGGDDGPQTGPQTITKPPPEPLRPPSQPPSGRSTPLSETGSMLGGRRGSCSSLHSQISPVDAGDLDLSQLSKEEQAQIEAVIARAREMQEEGEQRVREIEEDFGGPFQFAPVKPPVQTIKSTSGPPTAVKPVPQPAAGTTRHDSTHKSLFSQPLSGLSKGTSTQSTQAEPPKTLPKSAGADGNKPIKTSSAKEGYGQSLASQKTDATKQKLRDHTSEMVEKLQPGNVTQPRMIMTRAQEKSPHPHITTSSSSDTSAKHGQMCKNQVSAQDQMSSSVTAVQERESTREDIKASPQKTPNFKSVEPKGHQVAPGQSHKPDSQPQSQFKPYPKPADNVTDRVVSQDQQRMPLQQQQKQQQSGGGGIPFGNSKQQALEQRPIGQQQVLPHTAGGLKQQTKPGQGDAEYSKKQGLEQRTTVQKQVLPLTAGGLKQQTKPGQGDVEYSKQQGLEQRTTVQKQILPQTAGGLKQQNQPGQGDAEYSKQQQQSGVGMPIGNSKQPGVEQRPIGGQKRVQPQTASGVKQQTKAGQGDVEYSKQQFQQQHQHQLEQKRQDQEVQSRDKGDKYQSNIQRAAKKSGPAQNNTNSNRIEQQPQEASPTQAKVKESQSSGDIRPHVKNASSNKSKSPKPPPAASQKRTDLEDGAMCPLCTSNELNTHTASLCNVCETNICLNCGSFETSPRTKLKEWLCKICSQERRVMMEKKKGQMHSGNVQQFEARSSSPSDRHKNQRSSPEPTAQKSRKPKPASAIDSSQRNRQVDYTTTTHADDKKGHIARPTEFKQIFPVQRSQHRPPAGRNEVMEKESKHSDDEQKSSADKQKKTQQPPHPEPQKKEKPVRMVPKIVSGMIQMVQVPEDCSDEVAVNKNVSDTVKNEQNMPDTTKRPDSINVKDGRQDKARVTLHDQTTTVQSSADIISPPDKGKSPKSPRPNNLDINKKGNTTTKVQQQTSSNSSVVIEKSKAVENTEVTAVNLQPTAAKEENLHRGDLQKPVCPGGIDSGESISSKKKPSPLNRVSLCESIESEKSPSSSSRRSPSRISPRSPPRSPSWMRYRESPPRSPNLKKHSPTVSPAERFPSSYGELPSSEAAVPYGEVFHFPSTTSVSNNADMANTGENHSSNDVPPPKPARMSNQYGGGNGIKYDNMAHVSMDLASYAATVASSTAHLTSMSVSPTNLTHSEDMDPIGTTVTHSGDRRHVVEMSPEQASLSPPSPNYFDDSDEMELAEPSEKSIDYGSKRQKIKPPATDWSPITDLSPIIDVSPSVEKIEQEKMLQEQRGDKHSVMDFGDKSVKASRLERHKGRNDISSGQDPQIKPQQTSHPKGEVSSESTERQGGRLDSSHHHVGLPHANSEPAKPTQTINYPSRQAHSLDADARCTPNKKQDSSQDKLLYHSHPSFEGDREIDIDLDIPPQKASGSMTAGQMEEVLAPRPNIECQNMTFERQGGLVRSKLQIFPKDLISSDSDSSEKHCKIPPPQDSTIKGRPCLMDEQEVIKSPKQKILTSPESPKQARCLQGGGMDPATNKAAGVTSSSRSSKVTAASKEFMYPSPVTSPDRPSSPPCPASPSGSTSSVQTFQASPTKRPSAVSRSKSLDEGHIVAVRKSRSWDKSNQSPQSPGSDKERKTRRKLPTLPSSEKLEPSSPPSSKPVCPKMNSDKEILRKRLQEKAGRSRLQNKLENVSKSRPQSAPPTDNKGENNHSRNLPKQPPATAPKPKLPKILGVGQNSKEKPPVPPKPRSRNSSVSQEDLDQEDTVSIYGVEVPLSVRSMKKRIREEIQIVTATRRLKIDEMEEVRIMDRKLADREKLRRLRTEEEARKKAKLKEEDERENKKLKKLEFEIQKQRDIERQLEKERVEAESKASADKLARLEKEKEKYSRMEKEKAKHIATGSNSLSLVKMSPQSSPRRGKHRRQNSDPMLAKFSPIEEKDIENDMSYRLGIEARKLTSNLSRFSPQPGRKGVRSGSVTPTMTYSDYMDPLMLGSLRGSGRSKSSEILTMIDKDAILASSHSETNIPMSMMQRSRTHHFENEIEEKLSKEEKRQQLQMEIEKRRKALEENARLRYEIQKLTEAANVAPYEFEEIKTKYKKHVRAKDLVPTGIIRPLDNSAAADQQQQANQFSAQDYTAYRDSMQRSCGPSSYNPDATYSCSEYLAHQRSDKPMQNGADTYFLQPPGESVPHVYHKGISPSDLELIEKLGYQHALGDPKYIIDNFTGSLDSGMSSGSNLMDHGGYLAAKPELDACVPNDTQSEASITTTDTTPPSLKDVTPAMPILDDVTLRSRSKLRQIGSRPLSDDMGQYIDGTDLTSMFHAESDLSVAESDDHVMEGGVTIKESRDVKRPKTKDAAERRSYGFDIKRILLTKDPKERSVAGNGIGMKIVGGKIIPGTEEVGAYVADIYPGGVADQLHGELQEGDQVLEWNGIPLTGKTYEEVQHIISQPNGEIELVVRPGAKLSCKDQTMSTIRSESCHSSYDNLEPKVDVDTSDYEEFDGRFIDPRSDIDPDLVAARLAQNQVTTHHPSHPPTKQTPLRPGQAPPEHHISPGASPSSSQQDMYLTPSVSMSGSTQSDPIEAPSPTVELPNLGADPDNDGRDPHDWGEIQLQLSYDDYDGTLNIHVMQAKGLKPKDRNGLSDPFVKCYLLPGRIGENKRRTKIINRCLDPEWHQTLVFMKISKDDLRTKTLEVTVWDYDRRNRSKEFKPNDFLGVVYLDLGDLSILDNKPHWYKLHEPDDQMANQLSKPVTYASSTGAKQPVSKPRGHSQPIDESKNHHQDTASSHESHGGSRGDVRYTTPQHRGGNSSSVGSHGDRRDLHLPSSEHGAKYSPGLGRRKDIHRNDNCDRSPKKIYLDLTSSNCDNEDFLYSVQGNGIINNMAMHANQKQGTNNNHSPLLTAYKSRQLASDTTSMSSTSSGISFDSRIVKSTSDVMNDNIPVKNIVNTMYSFLGPGQLLTNNRTKANGLAIVSGAAYAVTGEILLGLKQNQCELVVTVIHCKGVTKRVLVAEAVQDWYVKVYLHEGDNLQHKVKKYKTSTQRTEKDPTFHDTFAISTQFVDAFVEVSLWINRGMFGQNKAIGTTIIALKNIDFQSFKNSELMAYYKFLAPK